MRAFQKVNAYALGLVLGLVTLFMAKGIEPHIPTAPAALAIVGVFALFVICDVASSGKS